MEETKEKNILDSVMYSYTSSSNQMEEENRMLKETVNRLNDEVTKLKRSPLMVCEVREVFEKNVIIRIPNGNQFHVEVTSSAKDIKAGDTVLCEQKNLAVIKKMSVSKKFDVEKFVIVEKPKLKWEAIGGLGRQAEEIKEIVELPLKKPELFKELGIRPPKGILLYGPPGTGKTMLAKAVAASTESTFIEVVGSELVQKFIGEGAKLIKEIFLLAREKAPAIVFIDELDALAAKRIEVGTSGEREVNRTFMQLLAELDGFKPLDNVKIIGATNRKDILDTAITRPGRLDRLIQIPVPSKKARRSIIDIHIQDMPLAESISFDAINAKMTGFSGAEIKAVCTEAGYFAIREDRNKLYQSDFIRAIEKVKREEALEGEDYMKMFG